MNEVKFYLVLFNENGAAILKSFSFSLHLMVLHCFIHPSLIKFILKSSRNVHYVKGYWKIHILLL